MCTCLLGCARLFFFGHVRLPTCTLPHLQPLNAFPAPSSSCLPPTPPLHRLPLAQPNLRSTHPSCLCSNNLAPSHPCSNHTLESPRSSVIPYPSPTPRLTPLHSPPNSRSLRETSTARTTPLTSTTPRATCGHQASPRCVHIAMLQGLKGFYSFNEVQVLVTDPCS